MFLVADVRTVFCSERGSAVLRKTILVVDDEEDILELLRYNLSKEGFHTVCFATGEDALVQAAKLIPDLIVLDLMLPGMDGLEVCRLLKQRPETQGIPIVMLTAKGEEADIVLGLELGADDYISKPFSPRVLVARVRAALRRKRSAPGEVSQVIRIHDLSIDPGRHQVLVGERQVSLTPTEFAILGVLARRPGWVLTRGQIIDQTKGEDYPVTDRSVDVQIAGLRRKLGPAAGSYVETVRGVGYRLRV
jgi:two-component system phosphate regulon response regulator PhoB